MKTWQVSHWCEPEEMTLAEIETPVPKDDEVLVKIEAAAINFFDILMVQGKYQMKPSFPFTPGAEFAGVVDRIGADVTEFKVGDRVQAFNNLGGFGEYALVKAKNLLPVPENVSMTDAAAISITYQTSYFALKNRANLQAGETLTVHAGAGGVGSSAIQLGKAFGAKVIATAGSAEKVDFCLKNGADFAFDYTDENWVEEVKNITGKRGANVIYDPVGGKIFELSTKCVASEGRILIIGFASGEIPSIAANRLLLKNASAVGCFWGGYLPFNPRFAGEAQSEIYKLYDAGKIKPIISQTFNLEDVPKAIRTVAERKSIGKIVIEISKSQVNSPQS